MENREIKIPNEKIKKLMDLEAHFEQATHAYKKHRKRIVQDIAKDLKKQEEFIINTTSEEYFATKSAKRDKRASSSKQEEKALESLFEHYKHKKEEEKEEKRVKERQQSSDLLEAFIRCGEKVNKAHQAVEDFREQMEKYKDPSM